MLLIQDLAQEAGLEGVVSEEKTLSVIDLIVNGGTGSILIISVLFVMLFVALYIYFERIFAIKAASKIDSNFMNQIRDHITNGKLEAAKILCCTNRFTSGQVTEKGISRIGKPLDDINTAIGKLRGVNPLKFIKLEKNVSVLATVAGAAPMIGFLGNSNW